MTMTHYVSRGATLARLGAGPLGPYLEGYAHLLLDSGFPRPTGQLRLSIVGHLSRWLRRRDLGAHDLDERRIGEFFRWYCRRYRTGPRSGSAAVHDLLDHLRDIGVAPPAAPTMDDHVTWASRAFERHLAEERGLAALTVRRYVVETEQFLRWRFGSRPADFGKLSAEDLNRFVLRRARQRTAATVASSATALRAFCRFLRVRGDVSRDLALSVLAAPNRRLTLLPKSITREEVERILAACDRTTAVGQRDYAILLTIARLGLRAGEIIRLTLDDIDWQSGEILVRGKGARLDRLPLPRDVGSAIATYLRRWRPRCSTRRLFVRTKAPIRGFGHPASITSIMWRTLDRAGLRPPTRGVHLLRYTLAVHILRRGGSLAEIGQLLRHRHADTTASYSRVDVDSLRLVAPPWPGRGVR